MNKVIRNEILEVGKEQNLSVEEMSKLVVEFVENYSADLKVNEGTALTVSEKRKLIGDTRNALIHYINTVNTLKVELTKHINEYSLTYDSNSLYEIVEEVIDEYVSNNGVKITTEEFVNLTNSVYESFNN